MAQHIGEKTEVTLDLKTIGLGVAGLGSLIAMWFALQADIAEAKELPKPTAPEITRMEFDMKDQLVRQTIMRVFAFQIGLLDSIKSYVGALVASCS